MDSPKRWVGLNDPGPLGEVSMLRSFLERAVKGQPKAINSVCKVYEYELTLRWLEERQRPVGVFMFLGPSGVGKTELTRMLSQYFMGSVDAMVKIDCSAFSQPHMIHSLIGAPHSYVGWDTPPLLSQDNLFKNLKKQEVKKPGSRESLEEEKKKLSQMIKTLTARMANLENDFDVKRKFSQALIQYHYVLHGNPENDRTDRIESVADILKDSEVKGVVLSMLSRDARLILENKLASSMEDAAILLDLIGEILLVIGYYKETEAKKKKLEIELIKLNREQGLIGGADTDNQDDNPRLRTVVLFDEIEKGSQALHNLLLQIMEEGRLTLANGSVTDLRNTFIVMTSNVGSSIIGGLLKDKKMGFGGSVPKSKHGLNESEASFEELENRILNVAERELEKTFSSAFRGRIDETVVFRPLTRQAFYEILDYHIELFTEGLNIMEIDLVIDREVKDMIIAQSFHRPEVGARLLDHKFKSLIKMPLGRLLSDRKDIKGTIKASKGSNDKIKFYIQD